MPTLDNIIENSDSEANDMGMGLQSMSVEAKVRNPRRKKPKTLQEHERPRYTQNVKSVPGRKSGPHMSFDDKKKVHKTERQTHGKLKTPRKLRHLSQINREFVIIAESTLSSQARE